MEISATDWTIVLEGLLKQYPEIHNTSTDVRITISMLNFYCFCHPYNTSVKSWVTRGENLLSENTDMTTRLHLAGIISYYYIWVRGNPKKADNIIRPFRPFIQKLPLSSVQALTQATFSSFSLLWLGRHDEFINHCHRALEHAKALGSPNLELQFLMLLMYPHLIQGEYKTAEHLITQATPLVNPKNPYIFSHFQSLLAWQNFQAGQFKLALEHAQLALQDSFKINQLSAQIAAHLGMAQILLSLGKKNEAQLHFDHFLTLSKNLPGSFFRYMGELFLARVALETGKEKDALQHLQTGLALAREQGFFFIWWWHPVIMVRLCCFALEEGIETDYVRELICHNRLLPQAGTALPDSWPWKVKITVLGDLSVLVDDKSLKTSGKAQHKLMEFLKVLIVLGGRNVAQENLIDILWPDVDGDTGRRTFDTTLHRLRKELGDKRVLTLSNGYLSLDSRFCWLDSWSLETLVKKINDALEQSDTVKISALTERLLQLYRGPLLTKKIETSWLLHARELFQQQFWNLIDQIGNYHEQQKSWDKAIACYQQGLKREPLSEPFYRRLICIYQRMGRNDESRAVYQQCLHALSTVGRQPSKETESCSEACKPICWKTGKNDF